MVRAFDCYPGCPGSNPIRDVGFFQTMHHLLFANFHIRKMGFVGNGPIESYSHEKNDFLVIISVYSLEMGGVMSHCTTHSFEIICRGWKVGLAHHMMRSFYK